MNRIDSLRYALWGWLLLGACAPAAAAAPDAAPDAALQLSVAPGQAASARIQPDGGIVVRLPSGRQQRLTGVADADGAAWLSAEDVDFDGRPELVARAQVGMVNEAVAVYRYDPGQQQLVELRAITHGNDQCGNLMGLTVDAGNRLLSSTCRSGPMWYVDQYRFDGARLYLYRAERMLMVGDALEAFVLVRQTAESGPLAVWSTFDAAGKVVETAIADGLVAPRGRAPLLAVSGQVVPARLPLYARPGDTTTRRYLLQDDRVELLDEADGWIKVRYNNPRRGAVLGWVNVHDR